MIRYTDQHARLFDNDIPGISLDSRDSYTNGSVGSMLLEVLHNKLASN